LAMHFWIMKNLWLSCLHFAPGVSSYGSFCGSFKLLE
jgi:hypothetical protein